MRRFALLGLVLFAIATYTNADEKLKGIACRSVHLAYTTPVSSALYAEVEVEESARGTYFMVCGWSKGYFGIQELADGKKLLLFSVWDPTSGDDPKTVPDSKRVKMQYKDPEVRVKRFGNEGTGGQSFFDYDWKPKTRYRFLVTARPDGNDRTAYSGHFFVPETKSWKHLVTFSTLTPKGELLRGTYSFIEDFRRDRVSATERRRAIFGNVWAKSSDGPWVAVTEARFTADANPVLNIDAGPVGPRFFLATGGDFRNKSTKLRDRMTAEVGDASPPADLPRPD